MNWKNLESEADWEEALQESEKSPVVIFKHSTRCSVSFMAKKNFETGWDYSEDEIRAYFLDLVRYRSVSDRIAQDTGVRHESPQIIFLKDKEVILDASHHAIDAEALKSHL
jgi:bacillithiol system protein YtxJ